MRATRASVFGGGLVSRIRRFSTSKSLVLSFGWEC
jgi:hypothetical protein